MRSYIKNGLKKVKKKFFMMMIYFNFFVRYQAIHKAFEVTLNFNIRSIRALVNEYRGPTSVQGEYSLSVLWLTLSVI